MGDCGYSVPRRGDRTPETVRGQGVCNPPWRSLRARMASRRRRQSGRAFYRKMLVVVVLSCQHATKRKFKNQLEAEPPASKTDTGAPATSMAVRAWPRKVEIPSSTPASHGQV